MENIHDIIIVSRNITSNRISVQHWPISDLCEQSRYIVIKLPDISFFFFLPSSLDDVHVVIFLPIDQIEISRRKK